ncbi:MAG: hypothetical protein Q8P80_05055 [Candidatus Levybacteria bacterium]|nr:hypothetical protein [Candidatus Levybacteria bacterium]
MNQKEFASLISRRGRSGKPSSRETERFIEKIFRPLYARNMSFLNGNVEGANNAPIIEALEETYEGYKEETKLNPSIPRLCATMVNNLAKSYKDESLKAFSRKDLSKFSFYYDLFFGMSATASQIVFAEEQLRDSFDDKLASLIPIISDMAMGKKKPPSIEDETGRYLYIKESSKENLRIMMGDPTGLNIFSIWIERFKKDPGSIGPSQSKEYVIAGAELGRDLYKGFYQIAQQYFPKRA